ncbi:MAG: hypothetical protein ACLFVG_01105 [Candidatus Aminicenantes bacterium]
MSWTVYGIIIVFGLFVLVLIFNPHLSCFGRTIRSPLHPLFRRKKQKKRKAEDYGFHLTDSSPQKKVERKRKQEKTEDYGFHLAENKDKSPSESRKGKEREEQD